LDSKEQYQLNKIHNEVVLFVENKLRKFERAGSLKTELESI